MNDFFGYVCRISLWLRRVWVLLQGPRLLQRIPVDFRSTRQCQLEEFCGCLAGILATAQSLVIDVRASRHLVGEGFHIGTPALVVEVLQQSLPFLMSIISQASIVGTDTVAPSGYLYAGIPFVEVFLLPRLRASSIQWPRRNSGRVASNLSCSRIIFRKRSASLSNSLREND